MFIRWTSEAIELEKFPVHLHEALQTLRTGTFTAVTITYETRVFVKRLTPSAYQLGLDYSSPARRSLAYAEQ